MKPRTRSFAVFASFTKLTDGHVQVSADPPLYVLAVPMKCDYNKAMKVAFADETTWPLGPDANNMVNCIPATKRDWGK